MNMSDDPKPSEQSPSPLVTPTMQRRPASWLSEAELRQRARRRNAIYLMLAAACMALFVVLIYLLLERTRWSAGNSANAALHTMP